MHADALQALVGRVQQLVLDMELLDVEEYRTRIVDLCQSTAAPTREIDRILVRSMLLHVAVALVHGLHAHVRRRTPCACETTLGRLVSDMFLHRSHDPQTAMVSWLGEFIAVYRRAHPPSAAPHAAALIRADPARRWTVDELARRVGCTSRALAPLFRHTYGVQIHWYVGVARLLTVFDRLATGQKITAIADDAGYRSAKDFYRVVRGCSGLTPCAIRTLPEAGRAYLEQLLRAVLAGQRIGATTPADDRWHERVGKWHADEDALLTVKALMRAHWLATVPIKPAKARRTNYAFELERS